MRPPSRPSQTAVWWLASASWWWLARNFSLWSGRPHRPGQGVNTYRLEITRSAGLQALQTNQHTTWTEKLGTTESFYCTVICTQYSLLLCNTGWIKIQCQAIVGLISGWNYYEFGVNETQQSGLVWSRLWSKSASQIKTSDTLVIIQTKPTLARHWILIHPVVIMPFPGNWSILHDDTVPGKFWQS